MGVVANHVFDDVLAAAAGTTAVAPIFRDFPHELCPCHGLFGPTTTEEGDSLRQPGCPPGCLDGPRERVRCCCREPGRIHANLFLFLILCHYDVCGRTVENTRFS